MNSGTKVELINDNWDPNQYNRWKQKGVVFPEKGKEYTIRVVAKTRTGRAISLEEIQNPLMHFDEGEFGEPKFLLIRFREVQPPLELEKTVSETLKNN